MREPEGLKTGGRARLRCCSPQSQGRILLKMNAKSTSENSPAKSIERDAQAKPQWANGLRKLYDSVVDEPLPDSFKDLLSKLDEKG